MLLPPHRLTGRRLPNASLTRLAGGSVELSVILTPYALQVAKIYR